MVVCLADDIDGFLDTAGLLKVSLDCCYSVNVLLTPSSIGTEKNSTPTVFAISSPPGTPGR